jgi:hypothetical protein
MWLVVGEEEEEEDEEEESRGWEVGHYRFPSGEGNMVYTNKNIDAPDGGGEGGG